MFLIQKLGNTTLTLIFSAQRAKGLQNSIQGIRHHFYHANEQSNGKSTNIHLVPNSMDVGSSSSIKSVQQDLIKDNS